MTVDFPTASSSANGVPMPGLDGTNPLGFLAALGVFRVLADGQGADSVRMAWSPYGGTWVPLISIGVGNAPAQDAILDALRDQLAKDISSHPAQILLDLNEDDVAPRRQLFCDRAAQSAVNDRMWADWLAAVASDFAPADAINQLQTTRRDYHYGNLTSVIKETRIEHLRRSIFQPWDYADPLDNQSLHLDPSEDRRHAHQWNKPAGDPDRKKFGGMLGANRLAIEAIPLFTSVPEGGTLRTIGFHGNRSTNTRWTWPIWSTNIGLSVVRSLLVLPELQQESPSSAEVAMMRARGVVAAYRTKRILVGKTPNFTPSRRVI